MDIQAVPFGVDTDRFNEVIPIYNRSKVFVYYKQRNNEELQFVTNFLNYNNIDYTIFTYGSYSENYYLSFLHESKYGIWIGRHESQGFALEEALSCNVPLFVWDVKSMNQEVGQNYPNIYGTAIPYWDNRCGEYFYDKNEFLQKFQLFILKLHDYSPRHYIIDNLSMDKCDELFRHVVEYKGSLM
jgi:glycosyltransferase involved in cell wall biosynthesis